MTTTEFKRKMQADGWNVRKLEKLEVFEISADGVPTFLVSFAELDHLTETTIGLLIAEKLRPTINSIFGGKI